ncbi:flagellar biosynthetic protein FliR [Chitinibacteraceae bacterium HSL-7]
MTLFTVSDAQINLWLTTLWWPFLRLFGFFLADPLYSNRAVSMRVKVTLALMLSIIIAPLIGPLPQLPLVSPEGVLIAVFQLLIGVAIGFAVRIMFSAVEMAGAVAGLQMGLGFAMFYDPQNSAQTPVVGQLFSLTLVLVFLAMNGHLITIRMLVDSFQSVPVSPRPLGAGGFEMLAVTGAQIFKVGVMLSLPVLGALLVTNLAIGVMTRAAPQLNVFAVGFPMMLAIGVAVLYMQLPYLVPALTQLVADLTRFIAGMTQTFAGRS